MHFDDELLFATKQAIICSHTHPEAMDGAYLVAKAISILCKLKSPQDLSPIEFLKLLKNQCQTQNMKKQFDVLFSYIGEDTPLPLSFPQENDIKIVNELGDSFQIKTIEAVPCSLWELSMVGIILKKGSFVLLILVVIVILYLVLLVLFWELFMVRNG